MNDFREPHPAKYLHCCFVLISKISGALHNNSPSIWATISIQFASIPPSNTSKELIKVPAGTTYSKITEHHPPFPNFGHHPVTRSDYATRPDLGSWETPVVQMLPPVLPEVQMSPGRTDHRFSGRWAIETHWCCDVLGICFKCVSTEHQEEMVIFDMFFF